VVRFERGRDVIGCLIPGETVCAADRVHRRIRPASRQRLLHGDVRARHTHAVAVDLRPGVAGVRRRHHPPGVPVAYRALGVALMSVAVVLIALWIGQSMLDWGP